MQTLQLVRVLVESGGYAVVVVCYFEHDPEVVAAFKASGAQVHLLNLDRSLTTVKLVRRLQVCFLSIRPRLVHVQYMAPGLLAIVAARLACCRKVVATVHQPWTSTNHGWKARWTLRSGARLCSRFLCVSEAAERSWFGNSSVYRVPDVNARMRDRNRKHCTIHNAIDLERIDSLLARTDPNQIRSQYRCESSFVVGTLSRLRHEKGIDLLIDAFARVVKHVPSARLMIVGEGPDGAKLREQAKRLGIDALIRWAGMQPWERAIQLMSAMDIVVVPSRYEGFGLTAAEAMACRKPLVATGIDSLAEVIGSSESGILVPFGDAGKLASAILELWRSPEKRTALGLGGRSRVEQAFSLPIYRERIRALYTDLLESNSRGTAVSTPRLSSREATLNR